MIRLHTTTQIGASPEACFDISLDVQEHLRGTALTQERIVSGRTEGILVLGEEVEWEGRHMGLRWRLATRITEFDRSRRFVDEMTRGPFKSFWHEPVFEPMEGGTHMTDTMLIAAPVGPLGLLAERLFLARHMARFLAVRNAHLKSVLESRRA